MLNVNSLLVFAIVTCRITGVIIFNPILGRRSVPGIVKAGLALGIGYNVAVGLQNVVVINYTGMEIAIFMVKEFAIGYAMGFVLLLFLAVFHIGGEQIDMQMGLSMGTMYDPTSNSQISISGNLITILFTLLFFITNSHMNLLGDSCEILRRDTDRLSVDLAADRELHCRTFFIYFGVCYPACTAGHHHRDRY